MNKHFINLIETQIFEKKAPTYHIVTVEDLVLEHLQAELLLQRFGPLLALLRFLLAARLLLFVRRDDLVKRKIELENIHTLKHTRTA